MMPKVAVGIPYYGPPFDSWWITFSTYMAEVAREVDFQGLIPSGQMTADHNRNIIADQFLETKAEWLFWMDYDTVVPIGAISRMLGLGKTLVSGVYFGKWGEAHPMIAYYMFNGAYKPLTDIRGWERGEILPVDSAGMGCMLTHRSVFEDIKANYTVYQRPTGGLAVVHNNDVMGEVRDNAKDSMDGKVYRGQLRERLRKTTLEGLRFPYFMIEHGRTEDMFFFELARRVGHKPWLDTSVECEHLRVKGYTGEDWRTQHGH